MARPWRRAGLRLQRDPALGGGVKVKGLVGRLPVPPRVLGVASNHDHPLLLLLLPRQHRTAHARPRQRRPGVGCRGHLLRYAGRWRRGIDPVGIPATHSGRRAAPKRLRIACACVAYAMGCAPWTPASSLPHVQPCPMIWNQTCACLRIVGIRGGRVPPQLGEGDRRAPDGQPTWNHKNTSPTHVADGQRQGTRPRSRRARRGLASEGAWLGQRERGGV